MARLSHGGVEITNQSVCCLNGKFLKLFAFTGPSQYHQIQIPLKDSPGKFKLSIVQDKLDITHRSHHLAHVYHPKI